MMTVTATHINAPSERDVPKTHSIDRAINALGNVLVVDEEWAWDGLSLVFGVRLTVEQRVALAASALRSLPFECFGDAVEQGWPSAGFPPPPLFQAMDEAKLWVEFANPSEIEAYLATCFRRLPTRRKSDFLTFAANELKVAQQSQLETKCRVHPNEP